MEYILFNKYKPVLQFRFSKKGDITRVTDIFEKEYAPVGIFKPRGVSLTNLNDWWRHRRIPASRKNLLKIFEGSSLDNYSELLVRSFALSLSDQYWIRPSDQEFEWKDINFFENDFSEDIGKLLIDFDYSADGILNLKSPENTSEGVLPKYWKIVNGKRWLFKGSNTLNRQEPYNEVVASGIAERLNIDHVRYELVQTAAGPMCACENFITPDTELVTAYQLLNSRKQPDHLNSYQFLKSLCTEYGIQDFDKKISEMLILDYLIANRDRHFRNIGFIRNVNTLQFVGFAPLYDNGTSLWNNFNIPEIGSVRFDTKPFHNDYQKQLSMITDFGIFRRDKLGDVTEMLRDIFLESLYIGEERTEKISRAITERADYLEKLTFRHEHSSDIKPRTVYQIPEKRNKSTNRSRIRE